MTRTEGGIGINTDDDCDFTVCGWQPIETAPKDGTRVLIYPSHFMDGKNQSVAWWNGEAWTDDEGPDMHPTHWHPLPDDPK